MTIKTSTLRPGLLVSLRTILSGNVSYQTQTIEAEHATDDGQRRAKWETLKTVTDPEEHEAGKVARGKARSAVSRVCSWSAFGLLCPEANAAELEAAIADARKTADAFNEGAKVTRLSVYVLTGRIAADDVEAAKAINSEVRELLDTMARGVSGLDPEAIREAANRARGLGQMLNPETEARLRVAIEAARNVARQIVKAGESAAIEVDRLALRKIAESRTAFLDLSDADEIAAPVASGRAVDLEAPAPDDDEPEAEAEAPASDEPATVRATGVSARTLDLFAF